MKSWKEVMTEEEIKAYEAKTKEVEKKIIELRFINGISCSAKNNK